MLFESTCPSGFGWVPCTHLVECMLNDHLAICVGDSGKQVPDGRVGLGINVLLSLGDGLRERGVCLMEWPLVRPQRLAGLFDDGLPDMVANSVEMCAEGPREPAGSRL